MNNESAQLIIEIEEKLFAAIKTKDIAAPSRIVADDFVFRTPGQPEMGKAEFLNSVKSIRSKSWMYGRTI